MPKVFVASLPKSGSTYLTQLVAKAGGLKHTYCMYEAHQNEQELHRPTIRARCQQPVVVQQHVQATPSNLQIMKEMGARPVFQVRHLFDALASMRDMTQKGLEAVFFPEAYQALPEENRSHTIAVRFGFWYIECYASWFRAAQVSDNHVMVVSYEQLLADPESTVAQVFEHSQISVSMAAITAAVHALASAPDVTRKTAQPKGRRDSIPDWVQQYIWGHTQYFPDVDFTPIGGKIDGDSARSAGC